MTLDLRHLGRSRPHGDGADQDAYTLKMQNHVLAQHLRDEDDKLADALWQAIVGLPVNGPGQSSLPEHLRDRVTNQHWRNSVGDPSAYGTGGRADNPAVELVSQKMVNPRPLETMANTPVGREHLTGSRHPITSTRVRPSDFDDEEN